MWTFLGLNTWARLDSVQARSEWNNKNIFEGIFIDNNENILEGTMTNIFFVKNKSLVTPSIISSGINGIMREVVFGLRKNFFNEIIIREIRRHEIENFDGMFLTKFYYQSFTSKKYKKIYLSNATKKLVNFSRKRKFRNYLNFQLFQPNFINFSNFSL